MADVEMTDAPKAKSSKAGPSGDAGEAKPRFEVKKVRSLPILCIQIDVLMKDTVERGRALGLGYCCRQLRHLPQSHHGSLHRLPG